MSVLPPPLPDASALTRGAVSAEPIEQSFAGPKRLLADTAINKTLTVGDDWEATVDGEDGSIVIRGLPLQFGGFTDDVLEGSDASGYRHYELELPGGGPPVRRMLLGAPELQFDWDFINDRVSLNGEFQANELSSAHLLVSAIDAMSIDTDVLTIGGVPVTPGGGSPPADATTDGIVTTGDQVLGHSSSTKTFGNIVVGALATLTSVVTGLVRAVGASLVLRSNVGALSGDTAVNLGTSVVESSLHDNARILTVASGIGGVQTEKVIVSKGGAFAAPFTVIAPSVANAYTMNLFGGGSAGVGGINYSPGGLGNIIFGMSSNFPGIAATNWPLVFSQNANAYNQSHLMLFSVGNAIGVLSSVPIFGFDGPANIQANQRLARWRVGGIEVAHITARGTFGCAGDMNDSISTGDQTINAAKGAFVHPAHTASSITITNDQVSVHSFVSVELEFGVLVHAGGFLQKRVEVGDGFFTVRFSDDTGATESPTEETKWRFSVVR